MKSASVVIALAGLNATAVGQSAVVSLVPTITAPLPLRNFTMSVSVVATYSGFPPNVVQSIGSALFATNFSVVDICGGEIRNVELGAGWPETAPVTNLSDPAAGVLSASVADPVNSIPLAGPVGGDVTVELFTLDIYYDLFLGYDLELSALDGAPDTHVAVLRFDLGSAFEIDTEYVGARSIIKIPTPSTAGMLALGGLVAARRRR